MDLVGAALAAAVGNHGDFVSAVSQLADEWKDTGLISGRDKGQITACAAQSDGGKGDESDGGNGVTADATSIGCVHDAP